VLRFARSLHAEGSVCEGQGGAALGGAANAR